MSIPHPLPDPGWPTAALAAKSRLFSPLRLRSGLMLESRGIVPAMVPWRATDEGQVTPALLDWYARFAEGEPGAIVVEATGIREVPSGPLLRIGHDRYLPGLSALVERVRAASGGRTRLFIQLIDFLQIRRRPRPEDFFGRFLAITPRLLAALAVELREAVTPFDGSEERAREALGQLPREALERVLTPRELRDLDYGARQEVNDCEDPAVMDLPKRLPGLFADAAARAKAAGFDGVELHYAHAYTMASFLSRTNQRTDGYGGSREGRLRLPLEVYAAVRRRVGPRFTVGTRFLGDEVIAEGSRIEDAIHYAKAFARAGFDYLSISKGGRFEDAKQPKVRAAAYPYTGPSGHECMPTVRIDERGPFDRNLPLSRAVREAVRAAGYQTPIAGAGGIAGFSQAEEALRRQDLDLVAAARQSLADPDWWRLMREGLGADVRRCIFTNYCEGLDQNHKEVTCQLWDKIDLQAVQDDLKSKDRKRRLSAPRRPLA